MARLTLAQRAVRRLASAVGLRAYAAAQMRIKYLYGMSKEAFYHNFNDKQPAFVQRIPQYLLASFLDITPEDLSEIRSKKRS